jgi:hypothetical protein
MAHTEVGFQVVGKFLAQIAPYGHPDFEPKLLGRGLNVMISPLPRDKRPRNPLQVQAAETQPVPAPAHPEPDRPPPPAVPVEIIRAPRPHPQTPVPKPAGFANNPFAQLELK